VLQSKQSIKTTSQLLAYITHCLNVTLGILLSHFLTQANEYESDEEDGGRMGLVKDEDVRSSISSKTSKRSARSRK
jgi:hypothetical protein